MQKLPARTMRALALLDWVMKEQGSQQGHSLVDIDLDAGLIVVCLLSYAQLQDVVGEAGLEDARIKRRCVQRSKVPCRDPSQNVWCCFLHTPA